MLTFSIRFTILGITIALFFRCIGALLNSANHRTKAVKWGLVVHTSVMFALATTCGALYADYQRISYIDNRECPNVDGLSPPGPLAYNSLTYLDTLNVTPYLLFFLNQCLADGFLVSSMPRLIVQVPNIGCSSALPLLHYLLHEPSGHCLPMFDVPHLYRYVFNPLQVDSNTLY